MCICACEQSTEKPLLMAFLPYNHLILYGTDLLNVMHVSKYSGGALLQLTPQHTHTHRVATPHTRISSFTLPAASVNPVGMVTLLSPSQATAWPHWQCGLRVYVCVCVSELAQLAWLQTSWHRANARPPPPRFNLLTIFFNYLQLLFVFNLSNRLREKNA